MKTFTFNNKILGILLVAVGMLQILYWINLEINDSLEISLNMIWAPILLGLGMWIHSIKRKKYKSAKGKQSSAYRNSKRILDDLLKRQLLTQTEYNGKINTLKAEERKKRKESEKGFANQTLHENEAKLLTELNHLKDTNILTAEEYESKKEQIILKYQKTGN